MRGLRDFAGFTDDDTARLRDAWPALEAEGPGIVDRFFEALLAHESTRTALAGPTQVQHLKDSARGWLRELCVGPHDEDYLRRRLSLGHDHLKAHLPPELVVLVMGRLRDDLHRAARRVRADDAAEALVASLTRACDLEAALLIATFVEARERRGQEELRKNIVTHLPMSVILLDAAGLVTTSSRTSPRVFLDPQPTGKPWAEVMQPALVKAAELAARIERARAVRREILMPRVDVMEDGGPASFRVTITPLQHPMAEVLLHVEDLTDTLASEGRATRAEQLAKLGTMAATVAHEIRNPLAGVSAAVQVVASTLAPDDARRAALLKVQEQVQRLGNLVGDLLSLSKPVAMNPRELDPAALARAIAESEQGTVEVRGAGLVLADASLLTQVIFNLTQNAWQAGARTVRVDVEGTALRVLDDGPGVPPELRERIFEPFFTTKTRGTGLGLPTARKIVDAMGGTLRVCDSPLGGACFEVQLPQPGA